MTDVESYEPLIRQILSAPGVDLSTISAKRVRKQLVEMDDSLSAEFVRENKEEFDKIIGGVYEEVSAARANGDDPKGKRKSRDEEEDYVNGGDGEDEEEEEEEAKPAKTKRAKKGGLTDEEVARQLDSEINGRQRSSRASSTSARGRGRGAKRGGRRGAKSSATVNSDGEVIEDGEPKKKRRGGGFQKEYMISEPLMAVIEVEKLSRPQTVKKLWDYIRRHDLQNPSNKKEILCDDKFKALFNVDKIDMFAMNKQLGRHLREPEPQAEA